jgi:hypothetical protein
VYGRDYAGKTLDFEPSGGLTNASLVMQDQQTDTYWSLMKGSALAGELLGESLQELPVGEKVTWKEWHKKHPRTKVLSVNGQEDGRNPYGKYLTDTKGFRGLKAKDQRMETKTPIFAFHRAGESFAVDLGEVVSGASVAMPGGGELFLFREKRDAVMRSTTALYSATGFSKQKKDWVEDTSGARFDRATRRFESAPVEPVGGFDTYWYNWSLNNPATKVLQPESFDRSNGMGKRTAR